MNFFQKKGVDVMQARYSPTIKLRNIAKDVEKQRLKCGVQFFSELMGRSKSWCCNFFNAAAEVKGVYPEDLKRLFAIEYNCVLFENKKEQMKDLLENAINSNICVADASLDKIFKVIEFRDERGSYHKRYKVPQEIFTGEEIPIAGNVYANPNKRGPYIFKEEAFIQYDKMLASELKEKFSTKEILKLQSKEISNYIKMVDFDEDGRAIPQFPTDNKDVERVENYIAQRMSRILRKEPLSCLSDYWLFATYYKYCKVTIPPAIQDILRKWYGSGKDNEINLDNLFNILQMEKDEMKKYDSGEIYFLNDTRKPISKNNLPIMYMKYDWKRDRALKERKIEDAHNYKFNLIDLYMLIYNKMLNNEYTPRESFVKTCSRLFYNGFEILFDKLDILCLPMDKTNIVDDNYRKFLDGFRKLFAQFEDSEQNPEFALFYKNFNPNQFKFLKTIAVDFSFIEKLSMYNVLELNEQISQLVDIYKKENLL